MTDINELHQTSKKINKPISIDEVLKRLDDILEQGKESDEWIAKEKARIEQFIKSSKDSRENI